MTVLAIVPLALKASSGKSSHRPPLLHERGGRHGHNAHQSTFRNEMAHTRGFVSHP